jgi:peroxiredoxin
MKFIKLTSLIILIAAITATRPLVPNYGVGDTVSDFKLKNVDGKMVSLNDFKKSKGVIVIFDCNTCPFSQRYNSRIIALHNRYSSQGFPVITINPNDPEQSSGDSFKEMVELAKQKNYTFPYLVDESQEVARAFGATNTPQVFVLKNEGNSFRVAYMGAIDDNARDEAGVSKKYVENAVDALVANTKITVSKTKALGCGIKWREN